MKRITLILGVLSAIFLSGCIKNDIATYTAATIEWDAAAWNANSAGRTYPLMTRVPVYGFATNTSASPSPLITRTTGTIRLRVNVVGVQSSAERTFRYQVVTGESTAVAGTHFQALSGTGTIPANSSFGYVDVVVLNPGAGTGTAVLVLEILESPDFKPSVNYAKVGLSIAQS